MKGRIITKIAIGISVAFVATAAVGFSYLSDVVNLIPGPPVAPVVALPADYKPDEHIEPYQGPHPRAAGRPAETFEFPIKLGDHGPVEPLFAGPLEYPFYCGENRVTYDQPLVDNLDGHGVPVFAEDEDGFIIEDEIVGYSLNCTHLTQARYIYNREGTRDFFPIEEASGDIAMIDVDGKQVPFVLRIETGTINRFHYMMVALRGSEETLDKPNPDHWNKKLIYMFRGGVGIGKRQGKIRDSDLTDRGFDLLKQGYGMVYSTANQTSMHYDMWLAEDTAARLKRQFVSLYGDPLYTVGIGGSGGAIQQYLIAQNQPGILDALIPLYSYPDMITQTINTLDCEPMEYYFDVVAADNPVWQVWENRSWIQGMNANSKAENRFTQVQAVANALRGRFGGIEEGASECVAGWRGLTPLVHNPKFIHFVNSYAPEVAKQTHFTHWDNLKHFYGKNEMGYANSTWDNVGVQYGLEALREGRIDAEEFLRLNTHLGGWKEPHEFKPEKLWVLEGDFLPVDLSFWSHHNMKHSIDGETPAPRTEGSIEAMQAAYRSGHVFVGHAEVPIIDARHYLEDELDMHHSTASFATRLRLLNGQGNADNQVIWMAHKDYDPINDAVATIDKWMANIRSNPEKGVAANKPLIAEDKCLDAQGEVIAQGRSVWNGDWNGKEPGACMKVYPRYKTSREVAGSAVSGDIFKCHLQPVDEAIAKGVYGSVDMGPYRERLSMIFPEGVCDYSRGDLARPADLMAASEQVATLRPLHDEDLPRGQISQSAPARP